MTPRCSYDDCGATVGGAALLRALDAAQTFLAH